MRKIILSVFCLAVLQYAAKAQVVIKGSDSQIHYMGRLLTANDKAQLQWSGTSASLNFTGTGVKVMLDDEKGGNFFNIIVDGKVAKIILLDKGPKEYVLAEHLSAGNH